MNLDELGNIGEFIGAIGVVVSFVFLAFQVRNNTRALRDNAEKEMAKNTAEALLPIIENGDFARIFRVGLQDWDRLDEDDRMRFSMHLFSTFFFYQHLFSRYQQRQIDGEYWASQKRVLEWYLRQPGVQRWWPKAKSRVNESFANFVDKEIIGARPG